MSGCATSEPTFHRKAKRICSTSRPILPIASTSICCIPSISIAALRRPACGGVNYWDAVQLRTLNEPRVRAASWVNVLEAADGALVLSATSQPIDLRDRAHLQQLERLVREIGLKEAQERCRVR
jgi:hypothetical protein